MAINNEESNAMGAEKQYAEQEPCVARVDEKGALHKPTQ
jgi:hypothetical protein